MKKVIKSRPFNHNSSDYETRATADLSTNGVCVEIFRNNAPVIVTFPDGSKATRAYYVELETRLDFAQAWGCDAVIEMMNTAEADLKVSLDMAKKLAMVKRNAKG